MTDHVIHTIPKSSGHVSGITTLNDRLYVLYGATQQIAIYCPATFQFRQHLDCYCPFCKEQSNGFQCYNNCEDYSGSTLQHIAACHINNCLYVSAHNSRFGGHIIKVAFSQNNRFHRWSVGGIHGLSVNSSHNLLVVMTNEYSLREYSTDGHLIRQINLQPASIIYPVHVVQLSSDQFAVTYRNHYGHTLFSIVSSGGQLVPSYGGDAGNMNQPQGIAVDQRGRIFVADMNNNRILVMDSKTLSAYPLPLPTDCKLDGPCSIHFDVARNRLYIGEWNGGRIVCCHV